MQIGRWHLDREKRTLSDSAETKSLTPRSWDVLLYLLDNRGQVVRTQTLLVEFWRGEGVDASYVRKAIVEIRRALGDDARSPAFIRTVPKRGYLFLQEEVDRSPGQPRMTIAVLPFANVSSDAENEFFADGITEEILNKLTQRIDAPVVARTSAFQFKGVNVDIRTIGRSLNASHILEGSVRKAAQSVRITAQLIDAETGAHLWSESYQRELGDVFVVQDEVSTFIASAIRAIGGGADDPPAPLRTVFISKRFTDPEDFKRIVAAISGQKPNG